MHPNSQFLETRMSVLRDVIRRYPLATVVGVNQEQQPCVTQAPALFDTDSTNIDFHLAANSAVSAALRHNGRALLVFRGPDEYISPDWYGLDNQVPTWNYVAIEAQGPVTEMAPSELIALLDALSAHHEATLQPKPPWTREKLAADRFTRMLGAILGFRLTVERLEGTFKLGQNKSEATRNNVAEALEQRATGNELAAWMRALTERA